MEMNARVKHAEATLESRLDLLFARGWIEPSEDTVSDSVCQEDDFACLSRGGKELGARRLVFGTLDANDDGCALELSDTPKPTQSSERTPEKDKGGETPHDADEAVSEEPNDPSGDGDDGASEAEDDSPAETLAGTQPGPLSIEPSTSGEGELPHHPKKHVDDEEGTFMNHVTRFGWSTDRSTFAYCHDSASDMEIGRRGRRSVGPGPADRATTGVVARRFRGHTRVARLRRARGWAGHFDLYAAPSNSRCPQRLSTGTLVNARRRPVKVHRRGWSKSVVITSRTARARARRSVGIVRSLGKRRLEHGVGTTRSRERFVEVWVHIPPRLPPLTKPHEAEHRLELPSTDLRARLGIDPRRPLDRQDRTVVYGSVRSGTRWIPCRTHENAVARDLGA